jgi:hypothetical protein
MWVAQMTNHCTISQWRTNSEVALAVSREGPLGPFEKLMDVVLPWAHNPQTIVAPDASARHGYVYAVYTLGDGVPQSGPPVNCTKPAARTAAPAQHARDGERVPTSSSSTAKTITANFTIHYAEAAKGPYKTWVASILQWPANWDYGAHGELAHAERGMRPPCTIFTLTSPICARLMLPCGSLRVLLRLSQVTGTHRLLRIRTAPST